MSSPLKIWRLRFEHHPTGFGLDTSRPRLSWTVEPSGAADQIPADWKQKSYQVDIERAGQVSSSFRVDSADTVLLQWPGEPLKSREQARVRVKSLGANGIDTDWSDWVSIEASLLEKSDLSARFITLDRENATTGKSAERHPDENGNRPLVFRKTFHAPETINQSSRSRLYITALGVYEARINGKRVGGECLAPGWTSYQHRILFQAFDVGGLIQAGENVMTIEVAEGWYSGRLKWGKGESNFYGHSIAAFAQLDILDSSGSEETLTRLQTDASWEASLSSTVASGIYDGETYDARETSPEWSPVKVLDDSSTTLLSPSSSPPVRVTEMIRPVSITKDPDGKALVDFGQNLVGRVRILPSSMSRPAGHRIIIRHAEVLEKDGHLGTRPLRAAKSTDTIIFKDNEPSLQEGWSPKFTYHGFRYIEITGWTTDDDTDPLTPDSLVAEVMHTDMLRTGTFTCSNPLLDRLHANTVWSMRGNFVGIPTDCPQRDERLGWTGDIQVFAPTASFLYDCGGMLSGWMRDLISEQRDNKGIVPLVVPNAMKNGPWPAVPQAVWDDVVILLPWTLYRNFGDVEVLRDCWQGMKDYLGTVMRIEEGGLWQEELWQLGDWLDPNAPPSEPGLARTDGVLVADAYLVHVTSVMARIATVLGLPGEADDFEQQAVRLKKLFQDKYIAKSGLVVGDSQTALALAIVFNLHEDEKQVRHAASRLARMVRFAKFRVSTGFAGTPVVLDALQRGGHTDLAYGMLTEQSCPSWLYPISKGATTIWERWDSMLEDGSVNPGEMTSFNHYALGSVTGWLHGTVAGISPLEAGWKKFLFRPVPGAQLTYAKATFDSPNGMIRARWELSSDDKGRMLAYLTVPPNTTADVQEPGQDAIVTVGSGSHSWEWKFEAGVWPPAPLLTAFE